MATVNPRPRVGDTGTLIRVNMFEDISGAAGLKIKYRKPDKTTGEVSGSVYNTTWVQATLPALDKEGNWILTPYTSNLGGWAGHGDPFYMHVYGIYEVIS